MPSLATVVPFPKPLAAVPHCAQCQTVMALERVEPHPQDGSKDRHTYVCPHCRLVDRIDQARG